MVTRDSLLRLVDEADRDPKADALFTLFISIRPLLYKLMKIKGWNARKSSGFLKANNIIVKTTEIENELKVRPLGEDDKRALETLVNRAQKQEEDL